MHVYRIRPDTTPVSDADALAGMHLMAGEDPELEADALRKIRAAAICLTSAPMGQFRAI